MAKKIQVVVIDDDVLVTKLLKIMLSDHEEYEVEIYNDSEEGFRRLNQKRFDVISLDHRMPKMTGMQIIKELRTDTGLNQHTPIVMLTGYRSEVETLPTNLLENVLFLEKPIQDEHYLVNIRLAWQMKRKITNKAC